MSRCWRQFCCIIFVEMTLQGFASHSHQPSWHFYHWRMWLVLCDNRALFHKCPGEVNIRISRILHVSLSSWEFLEWQTKECVQKLLLNLWTYSPILLSWPALMFHQYVQRVTVNLLCALKEQVLLLFSQIQINSGKKCCLFSVPTSSWRNDPDAKWTTPWYNQAFWAILGYSIRVDQHHFTEWYWFNHTTATANTSSCVHPVATHGHPTG